METLNSYCSLELEAVSDERSECFGPCTLGHSSSGWGHWPLVDAGLSLISMINKLKIANRTWVSPILSFSLTLLKFLSFFGLLYSQLSILLLFYPPIQFSSDAGSFSGMLNCHWPSAHPGPLGRLSGALNFHWLSGGSFFSSFSLTFWDEARREELLMRR